jgi:hypothetical protein
MKRTAIVIPFAVVNILLSAGCARSIQPQSAQSAQPGRYQLLYGEYLATTQHSQGNVKAILRIDTVTGQTDELIVAQGEDGRSFSKFWLRVKD